MILRRTDFPDFKVIVEQDNTSSNEEVCVDLRVGESFKEAGGSASYPFNKPYILNPGVCIVVRTKETISLPRDVFGTLCAKGSLAALGFLVPNTKVDPMFSDNLEIALFNAGTRSLSVAKDDPFCSIIFHTLKGPVLRDTRRAGIHITELRQQPARRILRAINKHVEYWRGVYGLIAVLLAILYGVLKLFGIIQ
jgi:deoxycytidine triphosphate deaminase